MVLKIDMSNESRSSAIKEMCKKFENTSTNSSQFNGLSKEVSDSQSPIRSHLNEPNKRKPQTTKFKGRDASCYDGYSSTRPHGQTVLPPKTVFPNTSPGLQWNKSKINCDTTSSERNEQKLKLQKKPISYDEDQPIRTGSTSAAKIVNSKIFLPSQGSNQKKPSIAEKVKIFEENKTPSVINIGSNGDDLNFVELRRRSKTMPIYQHTLLPPSVRVNGQLISNDIHHACYALARVDSNSVPQEDLTFKSPVPPIKPPRTFAHDRYIETKMGSPLISKSRNLKNYRNEENYVPLMTSDQKSLKKNFQEDYYGPSSQVFVDLTSVNLEPSHHYGTLKRSFSEEHVYAEPYEASIYVRNGKSAIYAEPNRNRMKQTLTSNNQLHYMSNPVVGIESAIGVKSPSRKSRLGKGLTLTPSRKEKRSSPNVRVMVNQSFNQLWKKLYTGTRSINEGVEQNNMDDGASDSGSEVSMKDIQERIIYVKSLKKKIIGTALPTQKAKGPKALFDSLLVSCLTPARKDSSPKPRLIYKFPKQERETEYEQTMIPQLCFPDASTVKSSKTYKSETFMFIIKDENGGQTFGFCLRLLGCPQVPKSAFLTLPAVVCVLTSRNAVGLYMKVLLEIEKHLFLSQLDFQDYISRLYSTDVPLPGRIFWLPDKSEPNRTARTQILRPSDNRIVNTEVTYLLQFLEVELLLKVIASLLLERRVLLVADASSTLFKCTTAVLSLLYPLSWQHSVIPVLPDKLLAQSCTNTPYLFGVSSQTVHKVMDVQKEKLLIVDLDQGFTLREVGDEHTILPNRSLKAVKSALSLAKNMTDPTEMLRDVMISEAFIRMFVETIGHCDDFITEQKPGSFIFQKEGFCKYPSTKSVQMFLTWFSETQMFEIFIEERIKLKETAIIRNQPGFSMAQGLFDRRLEEFWKQCHGSNGIKENVRGLGKKVKYFGEKLKGFKAF